jgi:hypothetical protein
LRLTFYRDGADVRLFGGQELSCADAVDAGEAETAKLDVDIKATGASNAAAAKRKGVSVDDYMAAKAVEGRAYAVTGVPDISASFTLCPRSSLFSDLLDQIKRPRARNSRARPFFAN